MLFVLVGSPLGYDVTKHLSVRCPESMGEVIEDTEAVLERMDGAVYIWWRLRVCARSCPHRSAYRSSQSRGCIGRFRWMMTCSTPVPVGCGQGSDLSDDDGEAEFEAILIEEKAGEILLGSGMTMRPMRKYNWSSGDKGPLRQIRW